MKEISNHIQRGENIQFYVACMQGIGEMGVNIFLREAQLVWEEAFPFADKRTLDMAKDKGLPSKNAKELAEHCDNDRYCPRALP